MLVDQSSFIRERPLFANKKCFANSMFIFRGAHVEQQLLLRFIHRLPNHTKLSRITSSQPCKHAASITESPSQDKLLLIRFFWQSLLGHSLQNALWLSPTLSQNFRENTPIRRPQPSAGGASKEKQTPGSFAFGPRKASLLEAWMLRLEFVSWDFRKQR